MDKKSPDSFSEALTELEALTAEFENGEVDLENGIPKFKRGMELARFLKKKLSQMENEVKEIKDQFRDLDEQEATVEGDGGDGVESIDNSPPQTERTSDIPF